MLLPDDLDPPLSDEDLTAYFEDVDPDDPPSPVLTWSVCDTGSAEFAMRKLAHAEAVIAQRDAEAAEFHRQIDRWLAGEVKPHRRAVNFFTGQLVTYARRLREEEKQFTLNLPSGAVTSRRNPARPEVAEDKPTREAFIAWATARELPLVKPRWSPVMDAIKKTVVFRTVAGPSSGDVGEQVYDVGDDLVLLPAGVAEDVVGQVLEGMNVPFLIRTGTFEERENVAIYRRDDGSWWLVPGVVLVPEEVTYTVKAGRP